MPYWTSMRPDFPTPDQIEASRHGRTMIAAALGNYRDSLMEMGFTRNEAQELVVEERRLMAEVEEE